MTDRSFIKNIKMPRTEQQFEEIRESRRSQIMETALELFANEGYHTTSISRIAAQAGISKGLMYNYFAGKEELIKAIIDEGVDQMMRNFDTDRDGKLTDDEFVFFINENFRNMRENADYWKLYYAILVQPAVFKLAMGHYYELVPKMIAIMVDYFREKGVDDPEMEAMIFDAVMDGVSLNFVMRPDQYPLDHMQKMIIERFSYKSNINKS